MSLELDDETLAALGWGTGEEREDGLHVNKAVIQPSRVAPGGIDGRHRRNWRRKAAQSPQRGRQCESEAESEAGHG